MAQLDNLERAHGKPVRLLWPAPKPKGDADAVLAELADRRVADGIYSMAGSKA